MPEQRGPSAWSKAPDPQRRDRCDPRQLHTPDRGCHDGTTRSRSFDTIDDAILYQALFENALATAGWVLAEVVAPTDEHMAVDLGARLKRERGTISTPEAWHCTHSDGNPRARSLHPTLANPCASSSARSAGVTAPASAATVNLFDPLPQR